MLELTSASTLAVEADASSAPQPFQYQGSKRALGGTIRRALPEAHRLVEPFAGSSAVTLAVAADGGAERFWLNDLNAPLIALWGAIVEDPDALVDAYAAWWRRGQDEDPKAVFFEARDAFNAAPRPELMLYLLARCVKGAVRYNQAGAFNQSADNRRLGTRPETLRTRFAQIASALRGRVELTSLDFEAVLDRCTRRDVVYLDPPYEGVTRGASKRYLEGIDRDRLLDRLDDLVRRRVPFVLSFDGSSGGRTFGKPLPARLGLVRIAVRAGRSSTQTLHGRTAETVEALYLSPEAAKKSHLCVAACENGPETSHLGSAGADKV